MRARRATESTASRARASAPPEAESIRIPKARVAHRLDGRARLHIPSQRRKQGYFEELERRLGESEHVESVRTNPRTGSVLVVHKGDLNAVAGFAKKQGLFDLDLRLTVEIPVSKRMVEALERLDEDLTEKTQGKVDLSTAIAGTLVGLAAIQVWNRRLLPPAWTLLANAASVLLKNVEREEAMDAGVNH